MIGCPDGEADLIAVDPDNDDLDLSVDLDLLVQLAAQYKHRCQLLGDEGTSGPRRSARACLRAAPGSMSPGTADVMTLSGLDRPRSSMRVPARRRSASF